MASEIIKAKRPAEDGDVEWEVMRLRGRPLMVRDKDDPRGAIVGSETPGAVVVGHRTHNSDWVKLADSDGRYVRVQLMSLPLLVERNVGYMNISRGTCAGVGHYTIYDSIVCKVAAAALGLRDAAVEVVSDKTAPDGCFIENSTSLRLTLNAANTGNGFTSGYSSDSKSTWTRSPICASATYPAFTTTTTTTATTSITATTLTTSTAPPTTSSAWPSPSFLCFSVMRAHTAEMDLLKEQLRQRVGIFQCDEYVVFSDREVVLGETAGHAPVNTWLNPTPQLSIGNPLEPGVTTGSWLNTAVFMGAFDILMKESAGRIWKHDWLVKTDPDTVFFPERLRRRLRQHPQAGAVFLANCRYQGQPCLYGALEVYSREAMVAYQDGREICKAMPWPGWGEDFFMQSCLTKLRAGMVVEFDQELMSDGRCSWAPCSDKRRAAFHPFKETWKWMNCWNESMRQ